MNRAASVFVCIGLMMPYLAAFHLGRGLERGQGEAESEVWSLECGDADWKTTVAHLLANKLNAIYTVAANEGLPGFLFPHHLQIGQV